MSYTKSTFKNSFQDPISGIQEESIKRHDLEELLSILNSCLYIQEKINENDIDIGLLWNNIIYDVISTIHSASSGFYRLANSGLRNVLELSCSSIFFYDHKVQYHLFSKENQMADKYVSKLVSEYDFFTSRYIRSFYSDIGEIETEENSISTYLKNKYRKLCDIVHGRFYTLDQSQKLQIEYSQGEFNRFIGNYKETLSIISVLYILRFNDFDNEELLKLANYTNTIKV